MLGDGRETEGLIPPDLTSSPWSNVEERNEKEGRAEAEAEAENGRSKERGEE